MGMNVCDVAGLFNSTLIKKKHREQDYAISNQHWVCKFDGMKYVSKEILGPLLYSAT